MHIGILAAIAGAKDAPATGLVPSKDTGQTTSSSSSRSNLFGLSAIPGSKPILATYSSVPTSGSTRQLDLLHKFGILRFCFLLTLLRRDDDDDDI